MLRPKYFLYPIAIDEKSPWTQDFWMIYSISVMRMMKIVMLKKMNFPDKDHWTPLYPKSLLTDKIMFLKLNKKPELVQTGSGKKAIKGGIL